jgi:ClpP class serine protease
MDVVRLQDRLASRLPGRLGDRADRPVVPLVRLHGVITPMVGPGPRQVINSVTTEKVLERAFARERLAAVALLVNSPGGSPTQSALVADRIRGLADEIYAHPTSIVGSIGVVSQSFGLEGLLQRIGVERRLYTAGEAKARLDPFLPEKPEDVAWLRGLQDQLHAMFREWVVARRGDRLASGVELFEGEVWTGARALELGLVDGLGTPRGVLAERFPDAELVPVEGRRPLLSRLGLAAAGRSPADLLTGVAQAAEIRTMWARYGL